jgi:hypothetical protein
MYSSTLFSPLKHVIYLNNAQEFSSCLIRNSLRRHYKDLSADVSGNNLCLL